MASKKNLEQVLKRIGFRNGCAMCGGKYESYHVEAYSGIEPDWWFEELVFIKRSPRTITVKLRCENGCRARVDIQGSMAGIGRDGTP